MRIVDPMTGAEWLTEHFEPLWPLRGGAEVYIDSRHPNAFGMSCGTDWLEPRGGDVFAIRGPEGQHRRFDWRHYRDVVEAKRIRDLATEGEL